MKVLLIEDDPETSAYIKKGLEELGHVVCLAANGRDGLFLAGAETYDVMVVDRMLPALEGLSLVRMIRAGGVKTPVLFLTALAGVGDRVQGLEAGGDDYLIKPFAFAELLARINALARRPPRHARHRKNRAQATGVPSSEYLMRHAGQVVTRTLLLEDVWEFHFDPKTNIVETHISRLRSKIDRGFASELIETVRGSGYLLRAR